MPGRKHSLTIFLALSVWRPAFAQSYFTEMVVPVSKPEEVKVVSDSRQRSVLLSFAETSQEIRDAFRDFDERNIKKVYVESSESEILVRLVLHPDRQMFFAKYADPGRIVLSFFSPNFSVTRDPVSNLPLLNIGENQSASNSLANAPLEVKAVPAGSEDGTGPSSVIKLLRPIPGRVTNSEELSGLVKDIPSGRGSKWSNYPVYIYPMQTSAIGDAGQNANESDSFKVALKDIKSVADYALRTYQLGDERRALRLYQYVLSKEPKVFEKLPLHLWAFAEANFGTGSLDLASGYYQAFIDLFPQSPLHSNAQLRLLDIRSIKTLRSNSFPQFAGLVSELERVDTPTAEIVGQVELRRSFWRIPKQLNDQSFLPNIADSDVARLKELLPKVETAHTGFLLASLVVHNLLERSDGWNLESQEFLNSYNQRYHDYSKNSYADYIARRHYEVARKSFEDLFSKKEFNAIRDLYESVSNQEKIGEGADIAWILAESYRESSAAGDAAPHYLRVAETTEDLPRKVEAYFWAAALSAVSQTSRSQGDERIFATSSRGFERHWGTLSLDNKKTLYAKIKTPIERTLVEAPEMTSAALAVKEILAKKLEAKELSSDPLEIDKSISLVSTIIKNLRKAGLESESNESYQLLRLIPIDKATDQTVRNSWATKLIEFAEILRDRGDTIEAGRVFVDAAEKAGDWSASAEAFYKGGLLLFRGGKRQEALEALRKASSDRDNLYYANLAKERIQQLSN